MILFQAFYWDCPRVEGKEGNWWSFLKDKVSDLANIGITALWLPPSAKSSHIDSMGYAPYDYYDHGEFDQKGGIETWFGSTSELKALIQTAHDHGMLVVADAVLNHCDIGDAKEYHPILKKEMMTVSFSGTGPISIHANTQLPMPAPFMVILKDMISLTFAMTTPIHTLE